jgi:hypothetical protein
MKGFQLILVLTLVAITAMISIALIAHAQPTAYDTYPLTLEENDFPPSVAGATTFQTAAATRNRFVIVYKNGLLQRPCPNATGCDYNKAGNVTITFVAGLSDQDIVTVFFYR